MFSTPTYWPELTKELKARRGEQIVRSEDHKVKFFTTGFVREFINANRPGGFHTGAVVADVEDHDFNQVANAAIGIADQKVERFHQLEKMQPPGGMGGMRAFLHVAKQGLCQRGRSKN